MARSRQNPDKPGKVYLNIIERVPMDDGSMHSQYRSINTGVSVPKGGQLQDFRDEAIPYVYNTYLVIDKLRNSGSTFTIDDVSGQLRNLIANDELKTHVGEDFVWDTEVATLKKDLIPLFRYEKQFRQHAMSEEPGYDAASLFGFLYSMSRKMLSEGRESTSKSYVATRLSLKRYMNDEDIPLADIDHNLVEGYAEWLKENGVADSTQSFYLRTLRAGINYAVKEGIAMLDTDMFRNVNTKVRFDRSVNKDTHLSREAILKIANMDLSGSGKLDLARDMFMFGFYCRGMELTDIIDLKPDNLKGDKLTYRRRGTGNDVTLRLDSQAIAILKKYKYRRFDFLFPLKTSPMIKLDRTLKYKVGTWLGKVEEMVGLKSLTFNMNISTWNYLMSQVNLPSVLLGT